MFPVKEKDPELWMEFHPPIPPLQFVVPRRDCLPIYESRADGPTPPLWVRQLCIAHATGRMPVVQFAETEREPGRFQYAADVDGFFIAWRDDGADVWSAVSVWCDWPGEDGEA